MLSSPQKQKLFQMSYGKQIAILLWFAFNLWINFGHWQQNFSSKQISECCDLLSIFELTLVIDNHIKRYCFMPRLWFAFNLWINFGHWQLFLPVLVNPYRCDLLSIFELTLVIDNENGNADTADEVVICFQSLN